MTFRLRHLRTYATLLALTSLAACSSKNDPTPSDPAGMSWTVDGNSVTATSAVTQAMGTTVTVAGATGDTGGVFLDVPKTTGTYALSSTSNESATYIITPSQGASQVYESTSGSIVVSSVSATNISGTFTFTGTLSGGTAAKMLTNGKFNVKL